MQESRFLLNGFFVTKKLPKVLDSSRAIELEPLLNQKQISVTNCGKVCTYDQV